MTRLCPRARGRIVCSLAALPLLGTVACGGAAMSSVDAAMPGDGESAPCVGFLPGRELARVGSTLLTEISGVVVSRAQEDVLWVHNDSGGGARVYAISELGVLLGTWEIPGAPSEDWEDIAIESVEGAPDRLWIGDTGDNAARDGLPMTRESIVIVRIDEPTVARDAGPIEAMVAVFETITLRYPDRARDCEAITVDPGTGDLYVLAKENTGISDVFVARAPLEGGADRTLEPVGTIDPGASMVTAADISPDGTELLVRTYRAVLGWERAGGEDWSAALMRAGRALPRSPEAQGESVAWASGARGYYTISEGVSVPIFFYPRCE
jgi:hypothetical protein